MLTRKGKYGLKAAVHLALSPSDRWILVADIAKSNVIPKKFLDNILQDLRNAGIVLAKKGKGGGYMLARSAAKITVGEVIRILDGPLEPISCAGRSRTDHCEDCPDKADCVIQKIMREVAYATNRIVDGKTLADLAMSGSSMWNMMRPG